MRILSIILILALVVFTVWQGYLTVKKFIDRKKTKKMSAESVTESIKEVSTSEDNLEKEEE